MTGMIKRAGLLAVGMAAAMLLVVDSAAARPRTLSWQDTAQEVEQLGPSHGEVLPSRWIE